MTEILIVLGSIICLFSLFAIVFPERLLSAVRNLTITTRLRLIAFSVRVLFGVIVILVAGSTQFPTTLRIIGILLIASGVAALLLGNARIQWLVDWFLRQGPNSIRIGGIAGLLFGGFLIYAVT